MENNVFVLRSKEELSEPELLNTIINCVKDNSYAIIRGLFNRDEIRSKIPLLYNYVNSGEFLPSTGVSREAVRTNMKKWSLGGQSISQANLARFMIAVFNPMFCEDTFGLHADFEKLIYIRDVLAKREVMTDDKLPAPKFNGTRIQIYPKGGGFLGGHIDQRAIESIADMDSSFIQLVMLVTEKGTDYKRGGAYVINSKKEYIDVEAHSQSGDVVIYDGNTMHGVEDIDPDKVFDQNNLAGRAVALVTIFN